jgi:radical SAM superfamily enzyme YgiQ (UPF0313 family)
MKIVLILPHDARYRYRKGSLGRAIVSSPLVLTTLASLVPPELKAEIRIVDEGVELLDEGIEADLIGITVLTATAPRAYALSDRFRARGVTVVLGGVHVTALPDEAAEHADAVVIGMGEDSWPELLMDFTRGKLRKFYRSGIVEIGNRPLPRRDLLKRNAYATLNTVMATRGCPNHCHFCSISLVEGKHYYRRPVAEVIQEIKILKAKQIVFLDSTLNGDEAYAMALFQALIPLRIKWAGLMTTKVLDNRKLFEVAAKSGCIGILFGFESISQDTLNRENKKFGLVGDYQDMVKLLHDYGITVLGCFIFGFDTEDESVFDRTVEFIDKSGIDLIKYSIYTPFPGTGAFEELKKAGRIIDNDWSHFDHEHVVFQPLKMSPEKLLQGYTRAWRETYRLSAIMKRMGRTNITRWNNLIYNWGFRYHALSSGATES